MIVSGATLRTFDPPIVTPFQERTQGSWLVEETEISLSGGLSVAGYDIHLAHSEHHSYTLVEPGEFRLLSSLEHFHMPTHVAGEVKDKSTLARLGLAVQNTIIEPGWRGYLTLELTNHSKHPRRLWPGQPIAQVVFYFLDAPSEGYTGKYQDQPNYPVGAR